MAKFVCNFLTRSIEQQAERLGVDKERVVIAQNLLAEANPNNVNPSDAEVLAVIKAAEERNKLAKQGIEENKRNHTKNTVSPIISIAPYRTYTPVKAADGIEGALAIRNKQIELEKQRQIYENAARTVASVLGIEIESFVETRGSWADNIEPSYAITFDQKTANEKSEEVLLFTSLMADLGHEVQQSALVTRYLPKGDSRMNSVEYSIQLDITQAQVADEKQGLAKRLRQIMNEENLAGRGFTMDWERGEIRFLVSPENLSDAEFNELLGNYNRLLERLQNEIIAKNGTSKTHTEPTATTELNSAARGELYKSWLEEQGRNHDKLSSNARELIERAQRRAENFRAIELADETKEEYYKQANPEKPLTEDQLSELQTRITNSLNSQAQLFDGRFVYRINFQKDGKGKESMFIYTEENLTASDTSSTDLAKLHGTYTPERLEMRIDMLARKLSSTLADLVKPTMDSLNRLAEELKAQIANENEKAEPDKAMLSQLKRRLSVTYKRINALTKWNSGDEDAKANAINAIGINVIVNKLLEDITSLRDLPKNEGYAYGEYQKILDNFSAMRSSVLHRFAYLEGITLSRQANENTDDEETGAYATGNDGWGETAHSSDSFKGISELVRSTLKNCVLRNNEPEMKKGKKVYTALKDDLGHKMYIDPKTAYQEIAFHLSEMLDDSDFYRDDKYVALEQMAQQRGFAWVRDVISYLRRDPDSAPLFYNAFRMDLTQFWHYSEGRFKAVNSLPSGDSFLNDIKRAVRYSEKYEDISIWDKGALSSLSDINAVNKKVSEARVLLNEKSFETKDENITKFSELIASSVRSIGANMSDEAIEDLVRARIENKQKDHLRTIVSELSNILAAAKNAADKKKANWKAENELADNIFSSTYNNFRTLGGELGYFNGVSYVASFQDAGATYYALEKPNFVTTLVKALKLSDHARRQEYMDSKFKSNYFMYDDVNGWKSPLLEELYNPDNENLRQMFDICTFNSYDGTKFPDMTDENILAAEVGMFFAPLELNNEDVTAAWYHVPNYSNAQSSDFIKYKRERGKNYKEVLKKKITVAVKQELSRIRLGQLRNEKIKQNKPDALHDNIEEINKFDKNSTKFCMYPFFETWRDSVTGMTLLEASNKFTEDKDTAALDALIGRGIEELVNSATSNYLRKAPLEMFRRAYIREYGRDLKPEAVAELSKKLSKVSAADIEQALYPTEGAEEPDADVLKFAKLIENFVWNVHYMQGQITTLTTGDLAFYKRGDRGVDFVKRFKEVTAAGDALFTQSRYGRRYSVVIGIKDHEQTSLDYNHIRKSLQEAIADGRLNSPKGREMAEFMLSAYENMNITDGQSFRSMPSLRSVMSMLGKWNAAAQQSYLNIMQGKYTEDDLYTVFVALKPFIFSIVSTPMGIDGTELGLPAGQINIGVPTQYKDSEAVLMTLAGKLSGAFEKSAKARGLERFMRDFGIDIAKFESTTKVGLQGAIDLRYSPSFRDKNTERWNNIVDYYKKKFDEAERVAREGGKENKMTRPERMSFSDYMDFARDSYIDSLKQGKISQETFNDILAEMEPDEDEVYGLLIDGAVAFDDTDRLPSGMQWVQNPNPYADWEDDGMTDAEAMQHRQMRRLGLDPQKVKFIDNRDYRIVQPTREHLFDSKVVLGVQVKNLATADLPENFSMNIRGRKFNREETRKFFHKLLVENLLEDFVKLAETFESPEALSQALRSAVETNPKYDDDMLQALQIERVKDPITGVVSSRFHTPMSEPANAQKLAEIVLSLFKNRIAKQTIFGGAAVIETGWSFSKDLHSVRDKDGNLLGYECYLPAWSRLYFGKYQNDDGSFDYDRMNKEHPELMKMIGYRIPTDHKHSMVPLIVKGFMPQQKANQIVIAEEAVVAAGEDKDIDKKYLIMPAFSIPLDKAKFKRDFIAYKKKKGDAITKHIQAGADAAIDKLLDTTIDDLANGVIEADNDSLEKEVFDFYLDNADEYGAPDIQKIEYDVTKEPQEQTRQQRNNMLFDMLYQILINPSVSDQTQLPTNFVNCKRGGFISNIAKHAAATNDTSITPEMLLSMGFDDLEKMSDAADAAETYDPFSPLNFARHHKANMDALKLVGIFASNLTVNAKYQGTDSRLAEEHHFRLNGKKVTSLVETKDIYDLLSSFNFSEAINASTDNGKDPSVARLGITVNNANIVATMLATGASINTVSFFLNQPILGPGSGKMYKTVGKILYEQHRRKSNKDIRETGITEEELLQNILDGGRLQNIIDRYEEANSQTAEESLLNPVEFNPSEEELDILERNLKAYILYENYESIKDVFSKRTGISRADSTKGGVDHTIGGAMFQQRKMGNFAKYVEGRYTMKDGEMVFDPVIVPETLDTTYPKNLREHLAGPLTKQKIQQLRDLFNNSGLSVVQAAHTLGIEATQVFMGKYFSDYTERTMDIYNEIMDNSGIPEGGTNDTGPVEAEKIINGLRTFALAGTDLFGDDGVRTMAQKRDYYIYEFPSEYFKILKENPELNGMYYFKNIRYANGKLRLDGATRITPDVKKQIRADIDNVFLGRILPEGLSEQEKQNKLAVYNKLIKDILCYSFYTGQLTFGATTIGTFLSDDVKHAFPEYIAALEHVDEVVKSDTQKYLFMDQLFMQGLIPAQAVKAADDVILSGNTLTVPLWKATNTYLIKGKTAQPIRYLGYIKEVEKKDKNGESYTDLEYHLFKVSSLSADGKTVTYQEINQLEVKDGTKFNPNSSFEEDMAIVFNAASYDAHENKFRKKGSLEELLVNSGIADFDEVADAIDRYEEAFGDLDEALAQMEGQAETSSAQAQAPASKITKHSGNWTRKEIENDPDSLYIFTDNTDRDSGSGVIPEDSWYSREYGAWHHFPTMTAAVARGLDNARPVSTQRWYHDGAKGVSGRWQDSDIEEFISVVDKEFQDIKEAWNTGKYKRIVLPDGDGLFNGKISAITKDRTPKLYAHLQEKMNELAAYVNNNAATSGITKVISGGQTGVDTIGLQIGRKLGITTGGTAPNGFLRERGIDTEDIRSYGLIEITPEEQADYTRRKGKTDPYTARTELNVRNSDGTVYFSTDADSAGLIATRRAAEEFGKPFILNPTENQLVQWLKDNNISTLNVAGNRGSKLPKENKVAKILENALTRYRTSSLASTSASVGRAEQEKRHPEFPAGLDTILDTMSSNFDTEPELPAEADSIEERLASIDFDALEGLDIDNLPEHKYTPAEDKTGKPCKK